MTHQQTSILDYFGLLNKQWRESILWENCLKLLDCSTYADVFTPFYFSGAFWCCQSANRSDRVAWSTPRPQSVRWICHFAAAAPSAKRQFPCRIVRFGDEVPLCFPHISLIMAWQVFFLCSVAASAHVEPEQPLRLFWMVLNNAWDGLMYSYLRSSFVLVPAQAGNRTPMQLQTYCQEYMWKRVQLPSSEIRWPRIHLAFAGQDASGYPSGMTVSWFSRHALGALPDWSDFVWYIFTLHWCSLSGTSQRIALWLGCGWYTG
jgi:hypothetical protein